MKKGGFILLVLLFLSKSCFYVDSDKFNMTITSDYNPIVNITSNFDGNDSLTLTDSMLFKYMIEIDTGKLYFADLTLGNYIIMRSDTLVDSLWIHPKLVDNNGEYELKLRAYFKSYTGSLADMMDADFSFYSDTSWQLTFIRDVAK